MSAAAVCHLHNKRRYIIEMAGVAAQPNIYPSVVWKEVEPLAIDVSSYDFLTHCTGCL